MNKLPWDHIRSNTSYWKIEDELMAAIILTESDCNQYAVRYEPKFKWFKTPDKFAKNLRITIETEIACQMMSWGLMQIMGATARDLGFTSDIPGLTDIHTNLYYGGMFLDRLFKRYGDRDSVIAAYNAGSPRVDKNGRFENQHYVDKVLEHYRELNKELHS